MPPCTIIAAFQCILHNTSVHYEPFNLSFTVLVSLCISRQRDGAISSDSWALRRPCACQLLRFSKKFVSCKYCAVVPFGSLTEGTSYAVARRNNQLDTFRRPATSNITNVVLCVCVGRVSLINFILIDEHFNCVLVVISITTWASPHTATVQQPQKGEHIVNPRPLSYLKCVNASFFNASFFKASFIDTNALLLYTNTSVTYATSD